MSDDISFKFGADISEIAPATRQVEDRLNGVKVSAESLAAALKATGGDLRKITPDMIGVAQSATTATAAINENAAATARLQRQQDANTARKWAEMLRDQADAAKKAAAGHDGLSFSTARSKTELLVLAHELSQGNYQRFAGSLMVLGEAMGGITLPAMAAAAAVAAVGMAIYHAIDHAAAATRAMNDVANAMANIGRQPVGTELDALGGHLKDVAKSSGLGASDVAQFVSALSTIPQITAQSAVQLERLTPVIAHFSKDQDVAKTGEALAKAYSTPAGLLKLNDELQLMSGRERDSLQDLAAVNNLMEMQDRVTTRLAQRYGQATDSVRRYNEQWALTKWANGGELSDSQGNDITPRATRNKADADPDRDHRRAMAQDEVKQTQETVAQIRATWQGSAADLARLETEMWQNVAADTKAGGAGVADAEKALLAARKSLRDADSAETVAAAGRTSQAVAAASTSGRAGALAAQIASDQAALASGKLTYEARQQIEAQLTTATAQLAAERRNTQLANLRQSVQDARSGSAERVQAAEAELQFVSKIYSQDTNEYRQALTAKRQALREYQQEQIALSRQDAQTAQTLSHLELESQKAGLEAQVQAGEISTEERIAQLRRIADAEYQGDLEILERERQTAEGVDTAWRAAQDRILVRSKQYNVELDRLAEQSAAAQKAAADKSAQVWERALAPIERAMSTSVTGIIMGTQTAGQAVARIAQSVVAEEISSDLKYLAHRAMIAAGVMSQDKLAADSGLLSVIWGESQKTAAVTKGAAQQTAVKQAGQTAQTTATVAGQTAQTGATVAGQAAQTAATAAGGQAQVAATATAEEEGLLIKAGSAIKSIAIDAYEAAAGAYAAVASIPYVGPFLAPVMAAGALAAVFAFGRSIFSAEGGMDRVPQDGAMFELHKDEMVLPAYLANPLRSALATGSPMPAYGLPTAMRSANSNIATPTAAPVGGDTHHHYSPNITVSVTNSGSQSLHPDQVGDAVQAALRNGHAGLVKQIRAMR